MPPPPTRDHEVAPDGPTPGNRFGIAEALLGLAAGLVVSGLALAVYDSSAHIATGSVTFGQDVVSLVSLWIGLLGGAAVASRLNRPAAAEPTAKPVPSSAAGPARRPASRPPAAPDGPSPGAGSFARDFGVRLRPWPDIPLGIAVGVAAQYLLVPLLELPLEPVVPHLNQRLGHPTRQLLGPASSGGTAQLVVIAILICLGSPIVEEIFFRGLLLRGLLGRLRPLGRRIGPAISIITTGLVFALVHFEALQFLGLAGLGIVLSALAWRTGRIGPSVVAHISFNTVTVLVYVFGH